MNILHVTPCYYPAWAYGGIPRVTYELTRELAAMGHNITVCTTDVLDSGSRNVVEGGQAFIDGVNVHYFRNLSNRLVYDHQVFLPIGLRSFLAENMMTFDVVHLHGHRHLLNNIARYYALEFGKPYILSGHGTVPRIERKVFSKVAFDMFFGNSIIRDASAFIAVSETEVGQYENMGVDRALVEVIYNGLDSSDYNSLPVNGAFRKAYGFGDQPLCLFLGKITKRKGVDFLVKAFARLATKSVRLVVAGNDMGFQPEIENIVEDLGLGHKVTFTGLLTGNDKLSAYRDADVVVYPAVDEIFGLVPFEALMCGTPVIVTDDSGCGEIISREGIGYLVRYNDIAGLTARIDEVLCDREMSSRKVVKGQGFVKGELSLKRVAERHVDLYRNIIEQG